MNTSSRGALRNHRLKKFRIKLAHNQEDLRLISKIEAIILSYRKTVFRMPKHYQPVVLLLSGGLDSIAAWEKLLGTYRLHVYPLVITARRRHVQVNTVNYFSTYFRRKYPQLYHRPYVMRVSTQNADFHTKILQDAPPELLVKYFDPMTKNLKLPMWGTNVFTAVWGYMYAHYLTCTLPTPVTTIFYGATADDGSHIPGQAYSFMRLMMLMLMRFSGNPAIQFGSVFYEESLDAFMKKHEVLRYGSLHGIPLWRTYSCDRQGIYHCGTCLSCLSRKYCFDYHHIKDTTIYLDQWKFPALKERLHRLWRRLPPVVGFF